MKDLVSILIPAYNAGKWLSETVDSALNQSWSNIEIIIVDDGSTDNTFEVAQKFESEKVKLLSQQNQGASKTRNVAYKYSQGRFIQWLDADDLLHPDKVRHQLDRYRKDGDILDLYSASWGSFYHNKDNARFVKTSLWQDSTPSDWLVNRFNDNVWMNPSSWLVSRELTSEAGLWNETLTFDDDGEYFCRLVSKCNSIKFVDKAESYYRRGNFSSLSSNRSDAALNSIFVSMGYCINYLLSIDDRVATRSACLNYLQNQMHYFYPEKKRIINELSKIANELGGEIGPPNEGYKFRLTRKIIGYQNATRLKKIAWFLETSARKMLDKFL